MKLFTVIYLGLQKQDLDWINLLICFLFYLLGLAETRFGLDKFIDMFLFYYCMPPLFQIFNVVSCFFFLYDCYKIAMNWYCKEKLDIHSRHFLTY